MNKLPTGKLTPRSNEFVSGIRMTGAFGQPDGFGSVLRCIVTKDGSAQFTMYIRNEHRDGEQGIDFWTVALDNEQRCCLARWLSTTGHDPTLVEYIHDEESVKG